jgi:uracil-DNA glycosylase
MEFSFANVSSDDRPRSMRDADVRKRRRAMLDEPHIRPLTAYAAELRKRGHGEVPDFDPLDGGMNAQVLFLFEKPGSMTADGRGSGFISRNNDDPTAEATFEFMRKAALPRKLTVTWNLIPWWNGTRKITGQELREGAVCVRGLIALLPSLRAVVLVGRNAAKAKPQLVDIGLAVFTSAHPSPLVRAKFPDRWRRIPLEWAKVGKAIGGIVQMDR